MTNNQQKESTGVQMPSPDNYLGSAKMFIDESKFLLSLTTSKVEDLDVDSYGKIKIDLVKFSNTSETSYGLYFHDGNKKIDNVLMTLQIDKVKTLSFGNEKGYISLTTNKKNPESIRSDKQDIVVYVNKYRDEMKDWTKEERNEAVRPNADDYVGGGWNKEQKQERQPNPNFLGTAIQMIPDEPKFLLNLLAEKLQAVEADPQFGKIKIDVVEFSKDGKASFGVYLHDDSRNMSSVHVILQMDKGKALSLENEKGYIPLSTNRKNPENIKADKQDIVVYVNKYKEEMKDWSKEEKEQALQLTSEDYVGGGWEVNRGYHQAKETSKKENIIKPEQEETKRNKKHTKSVVPC